MMIDDGVGVRMVRMAMMMMIVSDEDRDGDDMMSTMLTMVMAR